MMKYPMKCPYCKNIFTITRTQMDNNHTFRCPKCKRHNQGSTRTDADGVLIGVTKETLAEGK